MKNKNRWIFQPRRVRGAADGASVGTLSVGWCWAVSESLQTGLVNRRERVGLCSAEQWLCKTVGCCHKGVTNSAFYKAT